MVWIKDFPHLKQRKLLHTTHKHFGAYGDRYQPQQSVMKLRNKEVQFICVNNDFAQ